jgi:cell division protein FtsL
MKGKSALFWLGLAGAAGAVLFQTSYEVQELEEQLAAVNRKIVAEQEAIQVLKAEWSYLNDPTRLETLARTHLALRPTDARQFIASLDVIPMRPAPAAPDAGPAPLPPMAGLQSPAKPASPAPAKAAAPAATPAAVVVPASATVPAAAPGPAKTIPAKAAPTPQQLAPKPLSLPATVKAAPAKQPAPVAAPAPNDSMGVLIARLGGNR